MEGKQILNRLIHTLFFSFILLFFSVAVFAQSPFEFTVSEIEFPNTKPQNVEILKFDESYFLIHHSTTGIKSNDYRIERYDGNLKLSSSNTYKVNQNGVKKNVLRVLKLPRSIGFIYSVKNQANGSVKYAMDWVNPRSLNVSNTEELFTIPSKYSERSYSIGIQSSPGGQYICVSLYETDYTTRIKGAMYFSSDGDYQLDLLEKIRKSRRGDELSQILLTDDGRIFMVINKAALQSDFKSYRIAEVDEDTVYTYRFNTSPTSVYQMMISSTKNGNIIGACSFNATKSSSSEDFRHFSKGVFTFKLNQQKKRVLYGLVHPFSHELLFENWSKSMTKVIKYNYPSDTWSQMMSMKEDFDYYKDFEVGDYLRRKDVAGFKYYRITGVELVNGRVVVSGAINDYGKYNYTALVTITYNHKAKEFHEAKYELKNRYSSNEKAIVPYTTIIKDGEMSHFFSDNVKNAAHLNPDGKYILNNYTAYNFVNTIEHIGKRQTAFEVGKNQSITNLYSPIININKEEILAIGKNSQDNYVLMRIR